MLLSLTTLGSGAGSKGGTLGGGAGLVSITLGDGAGLEDVGVRMDAVKMSDKSRRACK